jgi:hypothetical protein
VQVAIEDVLADQQLLDSGITDRNIDEYLGLIEQRIDDLIQVELLPLDFAQNSTAMLNFL